MRVLVTIQYGENVHVFKHTIEALAADGHDVAVFAREKGVNRQLLSALAGHGSRSNESFTIAESVRTVDRVMDELVADDAHLVGLSLGGTSRPSTRRPCDASWNPRSKLRPPTDGLWTIGRP